MIIFTQLRCLFISSRRAGNKIAAVYIRFESVEFNDADKDALHQIRLRFTLHALVPNFKEKSVGFIWHLCLVGLDDDGGGNGFSCWWRKLLKLKSADVDVKHWKVINGTEWGNRLAWFVSKGLPWAASVIFFQRWKEPIRGLLFLERFAHWYFMEWKKLPINI